MPPTGHDIFVSYAHVDDDPVPGIDKGWVNTFVDGLRKYLARELGRPDAYSLWMDYELRGNEPLTAAIRGQLSTAKILLLFLSTGYLASDWCREELATFIAQCGPDTGRIFPVYVSPVDQVPEPLRDLLMYPFWVDERDGPRFLADPQPIPTEREYIEAYCRYAERPAIPNWNFYLAFSLFRYAGIVQGVYKRGLQGNASSEAATEMGSFVQVASDKAWELVQQAEP